MSCTKIKWKGF